MQLVFTRRWGFQTLSVRQYFYYYIFTKSTGGGIVTFIEAVNCHVRNNNTDLHTTCFLFTEINEVELVVTGPVCSPENVRHS